MQRVETMFDSSSRMAFCRSMDDETNARSGEPMLKKQQQAAVVKIYFLQDDDDRHRSASESERDALSACCLVFRLLSVENASVPVRGGPFRVASDVTDSGWVPKSGVLCDFSCEIDESSRPPLLK